MFVRCIITIGRGANSNNTEQKYDFIQSFRFQLD